MRDRMKSISLVLNFELKTKNSKPIIKKDVYLFLKFIEKQSTIIVKLCFSTFHCKKVKFGKMFIILLYKSLECNEIAARMASVSPRRHVF